MNTSILLVEDNKNFQEALLDAVSDEAGMSITVADSTTAARSVLAASGDFDLLVLDVGLPDGDGRDFCADLRKRGVDTPVIFLTGLQDEDDVLQGFVSGGDEYLTKPVNLRELLARITVQMRHRVTRAAAHLH